jgi:RNA recognition motif-containing protein
MARIVVKHLPYDTTEDDLRGLLGEGTEIVHIDLPRDSITGHVKGTASLELASEAEAADAVRLRNRSHVRGHRVVVMRADVGDLGAGAPLTEMPGKPEGGAGPPPQPHRPVREQGTNPGRWDH